MSHLVRQKNVFVLLQYLFYSIIEVRIANTGAVQSRKKVWDQSEEQRDVVKHKLWQIHVSERTHQHYILLKGKTSQEEI